MARTENLKRRKHPRYDVHNVQGSLRLSMDAAILNLSLDGMALETNCWLSVGQRYSFKLRCVEESIALDGRVAWCTLVRTVHNEKGETLPVYRAGIQFEDVLSEKVQQVRAFIESNAVVRLESSRVFGRFRVHRQGGVDVDFEKSFLVRRISLSGMLIEADLVPELEARFDLEIRRNDRTISACGRVAHVHEIGGGEPPRAEIGVEFLPMAEEDRRALEGLILHQAAKADRPLG